jgi:hypothetical protein
MKELRQGIVALVASVTLMLTTAGPASATSPEKSGRPVTRATAGAGEVGTAAACPASALEGWWATTIMTTPATAASDQVLKLPIDCVLFRHRLTCP